MRQFPAAVIAIASGVGLGIAAWGEHRVPVLALLLPVALVLCQRRLHAFLLAGGYAFGLLRHTPEFIGTWFDNSIVAGSAAVTVYAVVTGSVWSLGWSSSSSPVRRAAAMVAAWLIALTPPLALGVPGHPLVATGYVLPGFGWFGVALSLVSAAVAAVAVPRLVGWRRAATAGALVAAAAVAGFTIAPGADRPQLVHGVVGVRTDWGPLRRADDVLERVERMGRLEPLPQAVGYVWPESILGRYDIALYPVLQVELLRNAQRTARLHVIGMDIPTRANQLLNAAVAFYPDGSTATAVARQPAPVSLWKPWGKRDSFVADWTAHNVLSLGQGDRAAILFCYEEYLPALVLLNEAFDKPTLYVAMRNTWAAPHQTSATIQGLHSLGMARLFGRPYIQADNRPVGAGAGPAEPPSFAHWAQASENQRATSNLRPLVP